MWAWPEFLDDDEVDTLFQEQGGRRVAEVVEADRPEPCRMEDAAEAAAEIAGVERRALRGSEDEPVGRPARPGCLALFPLLFLVDLEGVAALGGQGDAGGAREDDFDDVDSGGGGGAKADRTVSEAVAHRPFAECSGSSGLCGAPVRAPHMQCPA